MLPGLVTCSRRVAVTFFLSSEESGCSRQGMWPFPLVFDVRNDFRRVLDDGSLFY